MSLHIDKTRPSKSPVGMIVPLSELTVVMS